MYLVDLTTERYYQNITRYEVWKIDPDYFIFYWDKDKTEIVIKKEYVVSIRKNN
jgi:hypothetical protein